MAFVDLLDRPFGPYRDAEILDEKCKRSTKGLVQLSSLMLECANAPIGFDETEFPSGNTRARISTHPIRFRGILTVASLDWLSPLGIERIETELRVRDIERRQRDDIVITSNLSLTALYSDGVMRSRGKERLRVKILLQGEKNLFASFLTCAAKALPYGLLLSSKDKHRQYEITSLDVLTASLSQLFFGRYRLLALMHHIVASDPSPPPLYSRTSNYFIQRFRTHHTHTMHTRHRRLLYHPNDSDVDTDGNTTRPRPPRHVSRAEARYVFAMHAEWIYADQLAKREAGRVVDVHEWKKFCKTVRAARKDAERNGVRWGLPDGQEMPDSDGSDSDDGLLKGIHIVGKDMKKLKKASRNTAKKKIVRRIESPETSDGADDVPLQNVYDSDFSEPSTPPASPSSSDFSDVPPPDPQILAHVSAAFRHPPHPPDTDFKWQCPVRACEYTIDMLALSGENVRGLHLETIHFLEEKRWKRLGNATVMAAFYRMVNYHYEDHLKRDGIKVVNPGSKKATLAWINPSRHRPWPPKLVGDESDSERVKEEEMEVEIITS